MRQSIFAKKLDDMRGIKFFNEFTNVAAVKAKPKQGRSDELIARRNECLLARYYYLSRFSRKCYEEIVNILVAEFYITSPRIINIIQQNTGMLQHFKTNSVTVHYFKRRWPHLKWR